MMTREICKRCNRENPLGFQVMDTLWNSVVQERYNVLCIMCFDELATERDIDWVMYPIEFYPVSGIEARRDGMMAYGEGEHEG